MILIEPIHVILTVEASIGDQFNLWISQHIKVAQQDPHGLHIGDVTRQFPVVKGKVGLLAGPSLVWHFKINADDFHQNYTSWDPSIVAINKLKAGFNVALRYTF